MFVINVLSICGDLDINCFAFVGPVELEVNRQAEAKYIQLIQNYAKEYKVLLGQEDIDDYLDDGYCEFDHCTFALIHAEVKNCERPIDIGPGSA